MQTIKLKRGLDIPFEGQAAETLGSVRRPEVFHIVPDQFAGITPKLDVTIFPLLHRDMNRSPVRPSL